MSRAVDDVLAERARQVSAEGWTPDHDDKHAGGEMAAASACYSEFVWRYGQTSPYASRLLREEPPAIWPWHREWWKPKNPRRDLVRSAALLIAEIERLDRATDPTTGNAP